MTKHVFWQALVFTIIVFAMGLMFGFFIEGLLADNMRADLTNSNIDLLDEQLRNGAIDTFGVGCDIAKESMFDFADDVYAEALRLERIDVTDKFDRGFLNLHRQYDLLRIMIWQESTRIKKTCEEDFHTVVYFYSYGDEVNEMDTKARQIVYSRLLSELKGEYPADILLIPIAGNLNLSSVDIVLESFGIDELPAIVVDEDKTNVLSGEITYEELENVVFESNN